MVISLDCKRRKPDKSRIRLGGRIRAQRKAKGWRLIDLAQHSGVKEVHLSYVERGLRDVGFTALTKIARGLGVSLSDLLKDIEKP